MQTFTVGVVVVGGTTLVTVETLEVVSTLALAGILFTGDAARAVVVTRARCTQEDTRMTHGNRYTAGDVTDKMIPFIM